MLRFGALVALLLIATCASAAERESDPTDEARSLHREAARASDYWTCLQLEAWAQSLERPMRLSPALGRGVKVHGSALWAFPRDVQNAFDRGDWVGVVTNDRYYRLSEDGRPLQTSVELPLYPNRSTLTEDGKYLGIIRHYRQDGTQNSMVAVSIMDAETGEVRFAGEQSAGAMDPERWDWLAGGSAIASDGSAIAGALFRVPEDRSHLIVFSAAGKLDLPNFDNARAVGPNGSWVIAWRPSDRRDCLIINERPIEIQQYATAKGHAVILRENAFHIVNQAGETNPWTPAGVGIGRNGDCWTRGEFLVVGSGWDATAVGGDDFLDEGPQEEGQQPYTTAIYRWDDVIADGNNAQPVVISPTRFRPDRAGAHALSGLTTEGATLLRWNFREELPSNEELVTFDATIQDMWARHHYYVIRVEGGDHIVISADGTELWRGAANEAWVHTRELVLTRHDGDAGPTYIVHHIDEDPFERRSIPLELEPGHWHIRSSRWGDRITAANEGWWHVLDPETGKRIDSENRERLDARPNPPRVGGENNHPGRWWREEGRLMPKLGYEELAAHETWVPRDAYLAGRNLVILDQRGRVYADAGRRGWEDLGRVPGAWSLSMSPDESTLTISRRHHREILAALDRGEIVTDIPWRDQRGQDLPHGRWRVERERRFVVPPSATQLEWDSEAIGFNISRLQGTESATLLAITASVVLSLDPKTAKVVGRQRR